MTRHLLITVLTCSIIILCMFRPFMPGPYDNLSITLSAMAQVFSFASLLFVPVGVVWLLVGFRSTNAATRNRRFALLSIGIFVFVAIITSVVAIATKSFSFAVIFLSFAYVLASIFYLRIKKGSETHVTRFNPALLYLLMIPAVLVITRILFIEKAADYSRNKAIANSEPLIQSIEKFYKKHGQYPLSLHALHPDFKPNMAGISQYYYEPNGEAYNLYFLHFSEDIAAEEIVMYNKFDEHYFAAHAQDILEYSGVQLALRRGDRYRIPLSTPHWIAIRMD